MTCSLGNNDGVKIREKCPCAVAYDNFEEKLKEKPKEKQEETDAAQGREQMEMGKCGEGFRGGAEKNGLRDMDEERKKGQFLEILENRKGFRG